MEYVYAALILHETSAEINESNLTAVLEAAGEDVTASRVKAIVAALEGVDLAATGAQPVASGAAEEERSEADTDAGADLTFSSATQDGADTAPFDALSGGSETDSANADDTGVTADEVGDATGEGDGSKVDSAAGEPDTDETGA